MSIQLLCKWGTALGVLECEEDASYQVRAQFVDHIATYGLSYGTQAEFEFRYNLYAQKDKIINELNADPENTFVTGHNKFSTWTDWEFKKILGLKNPNPLFLVDEDAEAPNTVWLDEVYAATV